jgi:predicted dehydrogenase
MTDSLPGGNVVRTALVGYGLGGSAFHAPFIAADPRMELAIVVTSSPERQSQVRARYSSTRVLRTFDQLLDWLNLVDLVVLSTPNITHMALAEAVLGRGRHVVVDKPVAPTAAQVRHLVELARRSGRHLVPFQNRRWDGDFRTVQSLLRSELLGILDRFESRYERWQPEIPSGPQRLWKRDPSPGHATGILYDLGSHLIDQAVVLFGRPVAVYAEVDLRRDQGKVDDDVFVVLQYPHGPRTHLWASALAADRGPRFRLLGQRGAYIKQGMDGQEAALIAGRRPGGPGWGEESPDTWGTIVTGAGPRPLPTLPGAYQLFYAGLATCLLEGTPPPVDPADAVLTAEIIEAAHRSAAQQQVIAV